jgi:hypothetical protein
MEGRWRRRAQQRVKGNRSLPGVLQQATEQGVQRVGYLRQRNDQRCANR